MAILTRQQVETAFEGKLTPYRQRGNRTAWIYGDKEITVTFAEDDVARHFDVIGHKNGVPRSYEAERYRATTQDIDCLFLLLGITGKTPKRPKLSQTQKELLWILQAFRLNEIKRGIPRAKGGSFVDGHYIHGVNSSWEHCDIKGLSYRTACALRDKTGLIEYDPKTEKWRLTEQGDIASDLDPAVISQGLLRGAAYELWCKFSRIKNAGEEGDPVVVKARLEAIEAAIVVLDNPANDETLQLLYKDKPTQQNQKES